MAFIEKLLLLVSISCSQKRRVHLQLLLPGRNALQREELRHLLDPERRIGKRWTWLWFYEPNFIWEGDLGTKYLVTAWGTNIKEGSCYGMFPPRITIVITTQPGSAYL